MIETFDLVRDPCYKYSKQAENKFLAQPVYSFLFACFSNSNAGRTFANEQIIKTDGDSNRIERMNQELNVMSHQAKEALKADKSPFSLILDAYFQRQL